MPDAGLRDVVLKRLESAADDGNDWYPLVLAALEGPGELARLLDAAPPLRETSPSSRGASVESGPAGSAVPAEPPGTPRVAFLKAITVEGFRGIGPKATLEFTPGPGLTLVVGRNGSGKSSFAEGLELLLTGGTYRWEGRTAVWKDGWRNLHHKPAALTAVLALEGEKGACTVAREWADDHELVGPSTTAQVHGKPKGALEDLGWTEALSSYRPFLSYNELGSMLEREPSKLYDNLAKILGLGDLVQAQDALQQERSTRDKALKDADKERKDLVAKLATVADDRARQAAEALQRKDDWGLATVEAIVAGTARGDAASLVDLLKRLAVTPVPSQAAIDAAIQQLREAAERRGRAARTVAGKADDLAALLDKALHFHDTHGDGDCPVCGNAGALEATWHEKKRGELDELRQAAREARDARGAAQAAIANAQKLVAIDGQALAKAEAEDALRGAADAVKAAAEACRPRKADDPEALGEALEKNAAAFKDALDRLKTTAADELAKREDAWRPHAAQIAQWLPKATQARRAAEPLAPLKKAEKWLKDAAETIRADRFSPIAEHATRIWDQLKLQSHVSLEQITLKGDSKSTQRRVDLDVTVDGQKGAALGVMSQGELHSLALSLFVPRATLPESPFRFVVIDDPVQSMDPARVDGLARVLHEAAKDRQVVVFTHDDRLPESVRRLGVPATQVEVTRTEGSVVALRQARDPVSRHLDDALTLAKTDDLPPEVARRVVPGLLRQAIEAACMEAIRRRRIGRGERHADVEALLAGIAGTKSLAALALFDDETRAGDVLPRLDRESKAAADTFRAVNEGSHEAVRGDLLAVVRGAEKLARWMQTLA